MIATIHLRYGESFLQCWKNIPKAIDQFHKALRIARINYGEKNSTTAMCYHDLGLAYEAMQDYPEALKFYQKAIISYSDGFDAEDPDRNPKIENIRPGLNLIETLKHKGLVLNTIYHSLHRKQDLVSSLN
ncbi:MAG: tetratricopeptide repeat protein, partial [Candidatus Woesearchaeota archaeon]